MKCPIHRETDLGKCYKDDMGYCADCKDVYKIPIKFASTRADE